MLLKSVPRYARKGLSFGIAEETRSDHAGSFGDSSAPVKKRFIQESGYNKRLTLRLERAEAVIAIQNVWPAPSASDFIESAN
jgi:hypothetical protein